MPADLPGWISRHRWLLAACSLLLFVAGGRLAVIAHYGTDLPLQDSWAADTAAFLRPMGNGTFSPATLLQPSNEHRVFFTNLTNATLAAASGRWDNRQQTVVNAFLCGITLAGTWLLLARTQPGAWSAVTFVVTAAAGGLPIVIENIVWGFQSQFLFVAGFSVVCLHQLLEARPGSWSWHAGWIAGLGAMLSFGSGFLAPLVVAGLSLARVALAPPADRRPAALTLAIALLLLGAGWLLRNPAPHHAVLHATSLTQFFRYLLAGMAWPGTGLPWLAPVIYAPLAWLAWRWCRADSGRDSRATFLLGAGLWVGLQIAAIAYSRSNTTMWPPANRYGELYLYGVLVNVAAGVLLVTSPVSPRARTAALALLGLVLAVFGLGAFQATRSALDRRLPEMRAEFRLYEKTVAAYVQSPDRPALEQSPRPYPVGYILANLLDMPAVRKYLPESVRPAGGKPSEPPALPAHAQGQPPLLSRLARQLARGWWLVAALGSALSIAVLAVNRLRPGRA